MRLLTLSPDQILMPVVGVRGDLSPDSVQELADDIRARGLLSPLIVSPEGDRWRLVAGSRRLAALKTLGWQEIPCIERAGDEEGQVADMLAENLHREQVNPLDEARVFSILQDATGKTVQEIAQLVSKSPSYVQNRLRVWHAPDDVRQALADELITLSAALELERCTHDGDRRFLLHHAVQGGATATLVWTWVLRAAADRVQLQPGTEQSPGRLETVVSTPMMGVCEWCKRPQPMQALLSFQVDQECFRFLQELRDRTAPAADALVAPAPPPTPPPNKRWRVTYKGQWTEDQALEQDVLAPTREAAADIFHKAQEIMHPGQEFVFLDVAEG